MVLRYRKTLLVSERSCGTQRFTEIRRDTQKYTKIHRDTHRYTETKYDRHSRLIMQKDKQTETEHPKPLKSLKRNLQIHPINHLSSRSCPACACVGLGNQNKNSWAFITVQLDQLKYKTLISKD